MLLFNHFMVFCSQKITYLITSSNILCHRLLLCKIVCISHGQDFGCLHLFFFTSISKILNISYQSQWVKNKQANSPKQQQQQQKPSMLRYLQDSVNFFPWIQISVCMLWYLFLHKGPFLTEVSISFSALIVQCRVWNINV